MDDSIQSSDDDSPEALMVETSSPEPTLNQLLDLPEEVVLNILTHMERRDLLAFSCTSRHMNRLGIQQLLSASGIAKPTSCCKLVLHTEPRSTIDPLKVLLHSVHIKAIRDLGFHFTLFNSYSTLASPLRRSLRLLHNLTSVREVTLSFGYKGLPTQKDEEHLQEMVSIFEELLNEMTLKSCKKIRLFGSEGLLQQFYDFQRYEDVSPNPKPLTEAKCDDDAPAADPVIIDDLRYSRTVEGGSRILLRCSSDALEQTQLTHFNFGTSDFLRPPFSQWIFTMLRASRIHSMSLAFSRLPTDLREIEYILKRLASVLPRINRLYLYDIRRDILPALIKWINMFPLLRTLQIKPGSYDGTFELLEHQTSIDSDKSPTHTFASSLRRIDGPHQLFTYLFKECGPEHDKLKFPALEMVHLDYFCTNWVSLDLTVLAAVLQRVNAAFATSSAASDTIITIVHLKFDARFRGLTPSMCDGSAQGVRPRDLSAEQARELAGVEKVRLSLPGTREEIVRGRFDDKILGCVSIFPGLRFLTLLSKEDFGRANKDLTWLHFKMFKDRNSQLERVYVRDGG